MKKCFLDGTHLERIKRIRSILKWIGIGFLLYKDIDSQIIGNQIRKDSMLKNAYIISNAYSLYLKEQINAIEKANDFLSKDEESNWCASIDSSKAALDYLLSFSNQQPAYHSAILGQLEVAKKYILNFNTNLEKAQLTNKLLDLKDIILRALWLRSLISNARARTSHTSKTSKKATPGTKKKKGEERRKVSGDISSERLIHARRRPQDWIRTQ